MKLILLLVACHMTGALSSGKANVLFKRSLDESVDLVFEEGAANARQTRSRRPGSSTKTNTCNSIRRLPSYLRSPTHMYPRGLTNFYQKYTEAYGIPVVSSSRVPDDALRRACYVLRFMMADHSGVRENFYKRFGRVGVMATTEYTTNIPEHSWLDPGFWNARARGLGATEAWPISTGAEENILCYARDSYAIEDIFLHEFAHGVHLLGAKYAIQGWDSKLRYWYRTRRSQGTLWRSTYAMSTAEEYFAEGVQSYFNVNGYANPPNGIHNSINTREKLRRYDPELYELIRQVFPCGNVIVDRCRKSRAQELAQNIRMDCDRTNPNPTPKPNPNPNPTCVDLNKNCSYWAGAGYCNGQYGNWMSKNCRKSCKLCPGTGTCKDTDANCGAWAKANYCNLASVKQRCKSSCNLC